jgi:hypothetical protein
MMKRMTSFWSLMETTISEVLPGRRAESERRLLMRLPPPAGLQPFERVLIRSKLGQNRRKRLPKLLGTIAAGGSDDRRSCAATSLLRA